MRGGATGDAESGWRGGVGAAAAGGRTSLVVVLPLVGDPFPCHGGWRGGGGVAVGARVSMLGVEKACSSGSEKCVGWPVYGSHIKKDTPGAAAARRTNHPRNRASPCGGFTSTPWRTVRRWRSGDRS